MAGSASASVLGLFCGLAVLPGPSAQEVQEAGTEVREERSVQMSEQIYRRLTAIHELLGDGQIEEALSRLDTLQNQRLSTYEEAVLYQTLGFCHAQAGDYPRAIEAFERCIAMDVLSNTAQQGMLYSLAGLYASEGRFEDTISTLSTWLRFAQEPVPADAYMLIGSSYAELERLDPALPYVREANRRATTPNESWYTLELSIYFENLDYPSAVELLREMVLIWPDTARFWEMLASAYLQLEDDGNALATWMVAYKKGLIHEEAKLLNLVRLNMFLDVPYEAGRILDAEMAAGRITKDRDNLELLLSAWTGAREFDRAVDVIDALAPMSDDGAYYMHKARLLNEQAEWAGVIDSVESALEKGGLEKGGDAYMLKGMAHAELGQYDAALEAFEEAKSFDEVTRRNADAWTAFVRDRQQVAMNRR